MARYYHFSYDAKDLDAHFPNEQGIGDSNKARNFILCVLLKTLPTRIRSCNESSIVLVYPANQPNLFEFLKNNIADYFYYTISAVAYYENMHQIDNECNNELNRNLQALLADLDCSDPDYPITTY
jgi:hypothetical protein